MGLSSARDHGRAVMPKAHLAAGATAGALLPGRGVLTPVQRIVAGAFAANAPDADVFLPMALDRVGIGRQALGNNLHHTWPTHTPAVWLAIATVVLLMAEQFPEESPARELADLLAIGAAIHLAQDWTSDKLPLAWPLTDRRWGLHLGRFEVIQPDGPPDPPPARGAFAAMRNWIVAQRGWQRYYRKTPSEKLERVLVGAGIATVAWRLLRR